MGNMHVDDIVSSADRTAADRSLDKMVAEICGDSRSCEGANVLDLRNTIMEERAEAVRTVERAHGMDMFRLCKQWPHLRVRSAFLPDPGPMSDAARVLVGFIALALAHTPRHVRANDPVDAQVSQHGGKRSSRRNRRSKKNRHGKRARSATLVTTSAETVHVPRTPADDVYDDILQAEGIRNTSANKYVAVLRSIDNSLKRGAHSQGGWWEHIKQNRTPDLLRHMKKTWQNPCTYRNKIGAVLAALTHARDRLGIHDSRYCAARQEVERECVRANTVVNDARLDNELTSERAKRMLTSKQLSKGIKRATRDVERTRREPNAMRAHLARLWLIVSKNVLAKRSDWGNCRVRSHRPRDSEAIITQANAVGEEVVQRTRQPNYIVVPTNPRKHVVLVLRDYKTFSYHGQYDEKLPHVVAKEIRASLKKYPREYLFVDVRAQGDHLEAPPFVKTANHDRFARWVKSVNLKYCKVGATINDLRRACVRDHANPVESTRRERKRTADAMLHTLQSQEMYRFVPPKKKHRSRRRRHRRGK